MPRKSYFFKDHNLKRFPGENATGSPNMGLPLEVRISKTFLCIRLRVRKKKSAVSILLSVSVCRAQSEFYTDRNSMFLQTFTYTNVLQISETRTHFQLADCFLRNTMNKSLEQRNRMQSSINSLPKKKLTIILHKMNVNYHTKRQVHKMLALLMFITAVCLYQQN